MLNIIRHPLFVLPVSFVLMWLSARIGLSLRKRQRNLDEDVHQDHAVIVSATLTLLGLIIGFSFSMAIGRYDQRKNYEEAEQRNRHRICPSGPLADRQCDESARPAKRIS